MSAIDFIKKTKDYINMCDEGSVFYNIAPATMARWMDDYHESELSKLNIPDVVWRSERLTFIICPSCGEKWNTRIFNCCSCGATTKR